MDFALTDEQRMVQQGVREVTRRFDLDSWREQDARHRFPEECWKALGEGGWLGLVVPPEYGGSGLGTLELALAIEELAASAAGASAGFIFILNSVFGAVTIAKHGSEEQKRRYLPGLAGGTLEFCMALTYFDNACIPASGRVGAGELARLMNHKAAWAFDRGLPCGAEANKAKYVAAEAAFQAADQAMQVHGGYGYTTEYHVDRYWRDLRIFRIAPVTQEMTLNYVAEHVLGLPKSYGA